MLKPALIIIYSATFVCVHGSPRPGYSYPAPSVRINDQTIARQQSYSLQGIQTQLDLPQTLNGGGQGYPSFSHLNAKSSEGVYANGYDGAVTVQKHVYVHVPPAEEEHYSIPKTIPVHPIQRHYKIIFIKAPAPPTPIAPIIPVQPQNEEKTLVYVLVKKPEEQPDIHIPTPIHIAPSKPEVYFVKYKTHKEIIGDGSGTVIEGGGSGTVIEGGGSGTVIGGAGSGSIIEGGGGLPIVEDAFRSSGSRVSGFAGFRTSVPVPQYGLPSIK